MLWIKISDGNVINYEANIYKYLFENETYVSEVQPTTANNMPLEVKLGFSVTNLLGIVKYFDASKKIQHGKCTCVIYYCD